ncbi:hypothetical protein [Streptomyces phytohabitans]|uniref:hypothetical protein n=1 Tax=Streptomyces phytohabitans TaxID=1150371 RepID=UPI00387E8694
MTVCANEMTAVDRGDGDRAGGRAGCVLSADGAYAARLALAPGTAHDWYPERWTLDSPEPYAVPLPGNRPEHPTTQMLPLADGRVLVARRVERAHQLALLYPTGPGTGETPLGVIDSARLTLLPPAPGGRLAYALVPGAHSSTVWLVAGGPYGPQQVASVQGRCSGGGWLDRDGRLLVLDRAERARDSRTTTKSVVVDLGRGGETSPLLQITERSDDRLLLADPDSGLLLVRSDAPSPGEARLGWGVSGSHRPMRFPLALRPAGVRLTPFAVQPGQPLEPENCAVALRADGPNGTWIALWRPGHRLLRHIAAPDGWLTGTGTWTADGELRLPYVTAQATCGVARVRADGLEEGGGAAELTAGPGAGGGPVAVTVAGTGTGTGTGAGATGGGAAGAGAALEVSATGQAARPPGAGRFRTVVVARRTGSWRPESLPGPPESTVTLGLVTTLAVGDAGGAGDTAAPAPRTGTGGGTGAWPGVGPGAHAGAEYAAGATGAHAWDTPPGGTPRPVHLRHAPITRG